MWSARDFHLVTAIPKIIRKKGHYLPFIQEGDGIEECFYGELVNLGYERLPNRRKVHPFKNKKHQPDFREFEVKAATSTGLTALITQGFNQHPDTVLVIVGLDKRGTNLSSINELKSKYCILESEKVKFDWNNGYSDEWMGMLVKKRTNSTRE